MNRVNGSRFLLFVSGYERKLAGVAHFRDSRPVRTRHMTGPRVRIFRRRNVISCRGENNSRQTHQTLYFIISIIVLFPGSGLENYKKTKTARLVYMYIIKPVSRFVRHDVFETGFPVRFQRSDGIGVLHCTRSRPFARCRVNCA